jgi:hypothetical protein
MAAMPKRMAAFADCAEFGFAPRGWRKIHPALVDVRCKHFDVHRARFIDVLTQLGGVRHVVGHHGAEEFDRVIGL